MLEVKQWDADFEKVLNEDRNYRDASHQIKYYLERTPEAIQWDYLLMRRYLVEDALRLYDRFPSDPRSASA
ncbi:hypothetical protein [Natronorarus salvus]|uniref:hypothetical protein n=1 Tax=Natronorarus salvus TaxID=3117733 RepID=UPI002F25F05B